MKPSLLLGLTLVFVCGCQTTSQKLVGIWKPQPLQVGGKQEFKDKLVADLFNAVGSNAIFEFNDKGSFKTTVAPLWETRGTYECSADQVTLIFDSKSEHKSLKFKMSPEGDKLIQITDFASDPQLVIVKQKSDAENLVRKAQ